MKMEILTCFDLTMARFNVQYAQELYAQQPVHNSPGVWK